MLSPNPRRHQMVDVYPVHLLRSILGESQDKNRLDLLALIRAQTYEEAMKLYVIVIGREPKYSPYISYMADRDGLAVFETRREALEHKNKHQIKNGHIVRFDARKPS